MSSLSGWPLSGRKRYRRSVRSGWLCWLWPGRRWLDRKRGIGRRHAGAGLAGGLPGRRVLGLTRRLDLRRLPAVANLQRQDDDADERNRSRKGCNPAPIDVRTLIRQIIGSLSSPRNKLRGAAEVPP